MFYGKCDKCDDKGSLEVIDATTKYCYTCYEEYLANQTPRTDTNKRDPDDERKYGRYNY